MFKTKQEALDKLAGLTDGNYFQNTAERYNALGSIWSKSALKSLACSPSDWFAQVPFRGSAKTEFGSLLDCLATEPQRYEELYVTCPESDKRKKGYLDAKKELEASGSKKTLATTKDLTRAQKALEALQSNPYGRVMLNGQMQRILTGVVELRGPLGNVWLPLKSKTDSVTEHADGSWEIEDLKSTETCEPDSIRGVCKHLSYHWQDALYTVLGKQMGHEVRDFRFVFVGTNEPYHVQPVKFDLRTREVALRCIEKALSLVYWVGHGYGLDRVYPEELIVGPYTPKDFWDTCPDYNVPQVEVVWP